jgi:hypothetical protein
MILARKLVAYVLPGLVLWLIASDVAFAQLKNPLSDNYSSIPQFISGALKVMVMVALPIITLFMVYSGFLFVFAQGNQEQLAKAKTNFVYVIIGSILILGAWVFASLIGGTISQLTA